MTMVPLTTLCAVDIAIGGSPGDMYGADVSRWMQTAVIRGTQLNLPHR